MGGVLLLAGAIAGIVAVYKKQKKAIEETAKASQARLDSLKKEREETEAHVDKIKELADAYADLKQQLEDNKISQDDLVNQTYELCMQYGEEATALEVLKNRYKDVDEALLQLKKDTNEELKESTEKEIEQAKTTIYDRLKQEASADGHQLDNFGKTIDLKGMNHLNTEEEKLFNQINKLAGNQIIDGNGQVKIEDIRELLLNNRTELQDILNNSTTDAAVQLRTYLDAISDTLDEYDTVVTSHSEALVNSEGYRIIEKEDIENAKDYAEAVYTLARELEKTSGSIYAGDAEKAQKAAENFFLSMKDSIDNVVEYAQSVSIAEEITKNKDFSEVDKESLVEMLNEQSDVAKSFLLRHASEITDEITAKDLLENNKELIKSLEEVDISVQLKASLVNADTNKNLLMKILKKSLKIKLLI